MVLNWTDGTPVDYLTPAFWGNPANEIGYRVERAACNSGAVGASWLSGPPWRTRSRSRTHVADRDAGLPLQGHCLQRSW